MLVVKLGFDEGQARDTVRFLTGLATTTQEVEAVSGDASDDAALASAAQAHVDLLVTGDRRHLLPLGEWRGVRLVTPQALLAELRSPS